MLLISIPHLFVRECQENWPGLNAAIASEAKQSTVVVLRRRLDCRVAARLAMTG